MCTFGTLSEVRLTKRAGAGDRANENRVRALSIKGAIDVNLKLIVAVLVGIIGISTSALAIAPPITLTDPAGANSTVKIDPYSQAGVYDWTVELFNQLSQSSYWYRIGNTGTASAVSALSLDHIDQFDPTTATAYYKGASIDVQVNYSLTGADPGSGTSDLAQTISVTNKTSSTMSFHLFQYVDFDLNGTAPTEIATRTDSSHVKQTDGTTQAQVGVSIPSHWEIGDAATLLNKLSTTSFTNLADSASPYTGDAAFAFQWDWSIAKSGSKSMSEDMLTTGAPVPEPSSAIALIGALGLIPALRRRRH